MEQKSLIAQAIQLAVNKKAPPKFPVNGEGFYQEVITIDPKMAAEMLSLRAISQRHLSQSRTQRYTHDMTGHVWRQTGDPYRFNRDMKMLDGQHRAAAQVEAGVTLKGCVVQVLFDEKAMMVLDQGAKRTLNDARKISGKGHVNPCCMTAILLEHCEFHTSRLAMMTLQEKSSVIDNYPARAKELIQEWRASQCKPGSGALAAAIACMRVDREQAAEFFAAVFNNEPVINNRLNKTAATLAAWIMSTRRTRGGPGNFQLETASRCIHAWNAHRQGRPLTRSQFKPDADMPQAR